MANKFEFCPACMSTRHEKDMLSVYAVARGFKNDKPSASFGQFRVARICKQCYEAYQEDLTAKLIDCYNKTITGIAKQQ